MVGRPPDVSDIEILHAIESVFGPATAREVSDIVGLQPSGTNKRLTQLADDNLVFKKTVGANAVVYWLTPEGERELEASAMRRP